MNDIAESNERQSRFYEANPGAFDAYRGTDFGDHDGDTDDDGCCSICATPEEAVADLHDILFGLAALDQSPWFPPEPREIFQLEAHGEVMARDVNRERLEKLRVKHGGRIVTFREVIE